MKEKAIIFLKGMILGLAMIIPGVSGGTLAISLGIYEKIITTISHFFKDFKNNVLFLINLGLGIVCSLAICSLILNYTFEKAPIPTIIFFIGLLIGSLPSILKNINIKKTISIPNVLFFLIGVFIVFGITMLNQDGNVSFVSGLNFIQTIKLILVGFVAAATLVIPGISGSFMLMVLGYYEPILEVISDTIKLNNVLNNLLILVPFGVGVLFGIILLAKLIEYLLKKYKLQTYYVIIGFLLASIIQISITLFSYNTSALQIIISTLLFIIGILLTLKVFKNE